MRQLLYAFCWHSFCWEQRFRLLRWDVFRIIDRGVGGCVEYILLRCFWQYWHHAASSCDDGELWRMCRWVAWLFIAYANCVCWMFTMERSTLRSGRRFFVVFVTAMVLSNGCNRMFMGCFRPVLGDVRSFFVWIFSITVLAIESFRWLRIMFVMFQVRGQRCFCQRQFDLVEERVWGE